jgi:hypothetical protein
MNDIVEWFENEFGSFGFIVSQVTVYDPHTFSPFREVLWRHPNGEIKITRIRVTPDLANDISHSYLDSEIEYKLLLIDAVEKFLEQQNLSLNDLKGLNDFIPKKIINKFKL